MAYIWLYHSTKNGKLFTHTSSKDIALNPLSIEASPSTPNLSYTCLIRLLYIYIFILHYQPTLSTTPPECPLKQSHPPPPPPPDP
jgi:hypothetical protein